MYTKNIPFCQFQSLFKSVSDYARTLDYRIVLEFDFSYYKVIIFDFEFQSIYEYKTSDVRLCFKMLNSLDGFFSRVLRELKPFCFSDYLLSHKFLKVL